MEGLLLAWLVALAIVQNAWCAYYSFRFRWWETPLGPVWLAKGSVLAMLWPLLVVNEFWRVPDWVWTLIIGPLLTAATVAWLVVTVRVRRGRVRP